MATHRIRSPHHEEEHENHERWLLTYADMITLLMVLFIVLFAIGQTDLAKFAALKHSLNKSFGGPVKPNPVVAGSTGLLAGTQIAGTLSDGVAGSPVGPDAALALAQKQAAAAAAATEKQALTGAQQQIEAQLKAKGLQNDVSFRLESRGLVVTVVTDHVLYDVGSASLLPDGQAVLDALAPVIAKLPNNIAIEGHTDNQPIIGGPFASNWELSTARATTVLRYLIDAFHFPPGRLSAAGYADTRPLVPNDNPSHQAINRRVEIVVLNPNVNLSQGTQQ